MNTHKDKGEGKMYNQKERRGVLVPASLSNLERQDDSNLPVVLKTVLTNYFDIRGGGEIVYPLLPPNFYRMTIGLNYLSAIMAITYHKFASIIFHYGFLLSNAFKVRPIGYLPILNYRAWFNLVVSTHNYGISQARKWLKKLVKSTFLELRLNLIYDEAKTARQFVFLEGLT